MTPQDTLQLFLTYAKARYALRLAFPDLTGDSLDTIAQAMAAQEQPTTKAKGRPPKSPPVKDEAPKSLEDLAPQVRDRVDQHRKFLDAIREAIGSDSIGPLEILRRIRAQGSFDLSVYKDAQNQVNKSLYRNHRNDFERVEKGLYRLRDQKPEAPKAQSAHIVRIQSTSKRN